MLRIPVGVDSLLVDAVDVEVDVEVERCDESSLMRQPCFPEWHVTCTLGSWSVEEELVSNNEELCDWPNR